MAMTGSLEKDHRELLGYRSGACYCRVDLHTHTPASECSSYSLPAGLEAAFEAAAPKSGNRASCRKALEFLQGIAEGPNPFAEQLDAPEVTELPRLGGKPLADGKLLRQIAAAWIDNIRRERGLRSDVDDIEPRGEQYDMLRLALRDLRNYLAGLLFPEEFVLRCYIEELQLVALTDHNHPGYVVPRLQELGTWHGALLAVNERYRREIDKNGGRRVRQTLLDRLQWAADKLGASRTAEVGAVLRSQHREAVKKSMKSADTRRQHIEERIAYWSDDGNALRPLVLLPGVEITVSGVHLLAVFPSTWYAPGRIGAILRTIGIPEQQWGRGFIAAATASVQDTMALIAENGGIAIPAHSNSDFKGLLRLFKRGLELRKVLEHQALMALETVGGTVIAAAQAKKRGKDACESLRWLAEDSGRPERARPLCFTKGSDAHECRIECDGIGEDLGMRYTNVKMDLRSMDKPDETFAALRLALLSGQSRVIESPTEAGYSYQAGKSGYRIKAEQRIELLSCEARRPTILGMTVAGSGAYADGLRIRFNPYLNCVVGSGGKSTLLRLLGYAFGVQGFLPATTATWLPKTVRVFWRYGERTYCIEREGRSARPDGEKVTCKWYRCGPDGKWQAADPQEEPVTREMGQPVEIWPPAGVQDGRKSLSALESAVVRELKRLLKFETLEQARPLLVNQPRDIFNSRELFEEVLSKPYLKARQIIWSTGSSNVPVAMDAEKIFVVREIDRGRRMELVCAGDLSEEEVREEFLDSIEGGYLAFKRRQALYNL